ncbi:MAG: helix-turn-helix domain-containing protein [Saprospiraceae bacterium]|nr:helix-turn-helix domain-containing protein [Candidatus Defluviibacterium haderslevense]MBK8245287.1 helix-turn-helix domain-containing protein [Candidatus Defluviibacterium haderslevense]
MKTLLNNSKAYLTPDEAAEYLSIKKSTLYQMTSKALIKHIKLSRKMLRFKLTDLDEFMDGFKVKTIDEYKLI